MLVGIGSDDGGPLVDAIKAALRGRGYELSEHGAAASRSEPWAQTALRVAREVASGHSEFGVVMCFTGTGVSIAANKVPGVRAALCGDAETARGARLWNNANVLALSLRATTPTRGAEILEAWLNADYEDEERDSLRILKLADDALLDRTS